METKKRSLSLILAIVMLLATACGAWALTPNADGVYEIASEQDLKDFRDGINNGTIDADSDAILTADIALTSNWTPIGTHVITGSSGSYVLDKDYSYNGTFDGNGKTITGLKVVSDDRVYSYQRTNALNRLAGLFGVTNSNAIVKNMTILDADLDVGTSHMVHDRTAVLVGQNAGQIENVSVSGGVVTGGICGGLVGWQTPGGIVNNCAVDRVEIVGFDNIGGLMGVNEGGKIISSTVKNLEEIGNALHAGGLVGANEVGEIVNCMVSKIGVIVGHGIPDEGAAGGLLGNNVGGIVRNCTVSDIGSIEYSTHMGGIAGMNEVGGTIINCQVNRIKGFDASEIDDYKDYSRAGGIVGHNEGTVENCTASEIDEMAVGESGGIVGRNLSTGTVASCNASSMNLSAANETGGIAGANGGQIISCFASDITIVAMWSAGGIVGANGFWNHWYPVVENSVASNCTIVAAYQAGGVAGWNGGILRNCAAVNTTAKSVAIDEDIAEEDEGFAGGAVGHMSTPNTWYPSSDIANCAYPERIVDVIDFIYSYPDEWAIGNLSPDAVAASYDNILSYDPEDLEEDIPGIVAILKQGVTVTVEKGKTFDLDVTTLPGTLGIEDLTCTWSTEGKSIVTVAPATGLVVTLTGAALGTETVTCEVRGDINVDLTCVVTVVDEVAPEITGTPTDGVIYQGDVVDFLYSFLPHTAIAVNSDGLAGSGLLADILNGQVTLTGTADGEGNYHYVVTLRTADGHVFTQTIPVTVQQGSRRHGGGGGSSNCNSGVGAAVFALLGLAYVYKKK